LNAPFVAGYALAILFISGGYGGSFTPIAISLLFATVVPILSLYLFARSGATSGIDVPEKENRPLPFALAMVSYSVGSFLLAITHSPALLTAFMLCYLVNTAVMALISLKWKISIHATGIAGPAVILIFALGADALPFLLLAIPVAWARISLKVHTPMQVAAGFTLTPVITYFQLLVYMWLLH
jgi:membrane-associated phospholipid phosphatase